MNMTQPPVVRVAGEGRLVSVVGDVYRFLVTGAESDGRYAMIEALVPPGGGPPPHVHSREQETFYVLDGEITFNINGQTLTAGPGTFANMPIGCEHAFRNNTDGPARMIVSIAPAGFENFFLEVGTPIEPGQTPPTPTPADFEKLLATAPKYGVDIRVPGH
ncbi:MAG: cupin domain-containing protein [Phycisphaera sp.]|nr:cupin domain-containing protein [Phycisphaera sp.]